MCGIAAEIRKQPSPQAQLSGTMDKVLSMISHRGPDGSGVWVDDHVVLGHRRLSIIDLSEAGRQPFHDKNKKVHIVFNGEIYNYKELRSEIEKTGYIFQSHTDTEVIMALYLQKGSLCVNDLRGMFAFVIYDENNNSLFIARDRVGKKPLYYYFDEDRLCICSELKAFHSFGTLKLEPNPKAIYSFLRFQYIMGSETIYKNIFRLEPGSMSELHLNTWEFKQKRYWDVFDQVNSLDVVNQKVVEDILEQSINYRLIADVEVGVLLSGGIDSTIISYFSSKNSAKKPRAFFVSFNEQNIDESKYASQVADSLGMELDIISGSTPSFDIVRRAVYHADEPLGDPAIIPTFLISEALSKHVKVVLSGEGADELFWGYPHYQRERIFQLASFIFNDPTNRSFAAVLDSPIFGLQHNNKFKKLMQALKEPSYLGSTRWSTIFSTEEIKAIFADEEIVSDCEHNIQNKFSSLVSRMPESYSNSDRAVANELYYWLPDDLLVKVDRMTMAHSVEARAPFLDQELIKAALSLSNAEKASNTKTKKILRTLLQRHLGKTLSQELINRPKQGFEVPLVTWLSIDFRDELDVLFSINNISQYKMLNAEHIFHEWIKFSTGNATKISAKKIWLLTCLLLWFEHHRNEFFLPKHMSTIS